MIQGIQYVPGQTLRVQLATTRNQALRQAVDLYLNKSAHNAGWITDRQTISRDISGHDATRADSGVASNANSGKDYRVRADPHVIFDDNWCGWRRYLTLFDAMLVPIDDKQVMTQQTVAADFDLFVCRNR